MVGSGQVYDPEYGVGYVFLANLIGSASTLLMLLPFIIIKKPVFEKTIWTKMMNYSFPLLITGLSGSINDTLDKVILRRMTGEETGLATVGEYGAGYKIAVLMALFIQMFRFAAEPFFFERAKYRKCKGNLFICNEVFHNYHAYWFTWRLIYIYPDFS